MSRSAEKRTGAGGNFDPTTLGFPAYVSQTAGPNGQIFPRFDVSGGFAGLGPNGYNAFSQNPFAHDITGSLVKIVGAHSIKFGGEFRKIYSNFYQYGRPSGYYSLDNTWTQDVAQTTVDGTNTGNPYASFLLGLVGSGYTEHTPSAASSSGYFALYAQDDWKVSKKLTLNLGLRWDVEIPRTERYNKLSYWDPTVPNPLASVTPAVGVNCPHCSQLMGAMFFPGSTGKYGRHQGPTQLHDFAPGSASLTTPAMAWWFAVVSESSMPLQTYRRPEPRAVWGIRASKAQPIWLPASTTKLRSMPRYPILIPSRAPGSVTICHRVRRVARSPRSAAESQTRSSLLIGIPTIFSGTSRSRMPCLPKPPWRSATWAITGCFWSMGIRAQTSISCRLRTWLWGMHSSPRFRTRSVS